MDEPRTYAWIFYAVEMASGREPADYAAISEMADGINHAVPSHRELQASLAWLREAGLVAQYGRRYAVTPLGIALVAQCREGCTTIPQVWRRITEAFESQVPGGSNPSLQARRP